MQESIMSVPCTTKKSCNPHPENGTRTTCGDGGCRTGDVTRADLGGNGGGKSLEGAHAALLLTAAQREVAEHTPPAFFKAADLDEVRLDREEKAAADEHDYQNVI